jgi:hypothetical protein
MTPIGGFLPLEIGAGGPLYHAGAAALTSGRACWHAILRATRPSRVLVPFYVCDAVLTPLAATGTPFTFYAIDASFRPDGAAPGPGELMVVVNYFGVMTAWIDSYLSASQADRVVVDDAQAFFRRGTPDAWSFNSARKFFGVPDGAFLYGPATGIEHLPPSDNGDCEHLLTRIAGNDGLAWSQFKAHEARIGIEPRAISRISARLLAAVDIAAARCRRRANFDALHRELASLNTIELAPPTSDDGPMCYPLLPEADVDRGLLAERGLFVPTLWPEIHGRADSGFARERLIARRLLPLPIDHRYGPDDMVTVARTILQVLR